MFIERTKMSTFHDNDTLMHNFSCFFVNKSRQFTAKATLTSDKIFYGYLIALYTEEIVSMIRKYHNHKLQTNPWHNKKEPHNNHETP